MEDGTYVVKDGIVYKITPKIKIPFAKSVNVMTGKIYYPSNADRIRAMSDEELAKFITSGYYQPHCPVGSCPVVEDCEDCWLRWLKEEVKE